MNKIKLILPLILLVLIPLWGIRSITDSYTAESTGDYKTALAVVDELITANGNDGFYQVRKAWLIYLTKDYSAAVTAYQAAIKLQDNLDAQTGLINSLLALGRYADALALCRQQAVVHPQNPVLLGKGGYAAYLLKDYKSAAEFYAEIIKTYPWDMETRGYLMNNLYLSGQTDAARNQYFFLKKYYPQSEVLSTYQSIFEP